MGVICGQHYKIIALDIILIICLILLMHDKYFLKKEKLADLFFDIVKYLLTTLGAIILLAEKPISPVTVTIVVVIAVIILTLAVFITPLREE